MAEKRAENGFACFAPFPYYSKCDTNNVASSCYKLREGMSSINKQESSQ